MRIVIASACLRIAACGSERAAPELEPTPRTESAEVPRALEEPTEDELRDSIERRVREGYAERGDIIDDVVDVFEASRPLRATVTRLVDAELARHRQREATWTAPTDCDRLTAAFEALDRSGIVARERWSDCQTCGAGEIADEMDRLAAEGAHVRGYVFFHDQDVERVVDPEYGGELYLSYGARDGGDAASIAVGHEIVRVLRAHGLGVEWSGSNAQRISIVHLDWRRRRFTPAPPIAAP